MRQPASGRDRIRRVFIVNIAAAVVIGVRVADSFSCVYLLHASRVAPQTRSSVYSLKDLSALIERQRARCKPRTIRWRNNGPVLRAAYTAGSPERRWRRRFCALYLNVTRARALQQSAADRKGTALVISLPYASKLNCLRAQPIGCWNEAHR